MVLDAKGQLGAPEEYRDYLLLVVAGVWENLLLGKVDPSDLVQQTLLEAFEKRGQFLGQTDKEWKAWLRSILTHNLQDEIRKLKRGRRDVLREQSLEVAIEQSATRAEIILSADQSTPSERAAKQEQLTLLEEMLQKLPADQQDVVRLHHLEGMSLATMAGRLGRTQPSVAGLLRRGLKRLRELMADKK